MAQEIMRTEKITEVQRLSSKVAARIRYAQVVHAPIPADQIAALVGAARLLQEHGVPLRPIVNQALRSLALGFKNY